MDIHNPNCDGSQCRSNTGEVRKLPYSTEGNLILCRACYQHEILYRIARNNTLAPESKFDLPTWESLAVYPVAG